MILLEKYPQLKEYVEQFGTMGAFQHRGTIYSFLDSFEEIPAKKVQNAKNSIGKHLSSDETLLLLVDNTLFGSATDGVIFTDKAIHYKELFSDPEVVFYEQIDSISVSRKDGKLNLFLDGNIKTIGAIGVKEYLLLFSLTNFIIGASYLIRTNNQNIVIDDNEIDNFLADIYFSNVTFEGEPEPPSKFEEFLNRHEDSIRDAFDKLGINDLILKLEDDEKLIPHIDKVYELLPTPVRFVISRDKFRKFVLENKNTFLKSLGV